MDENCKRQKEVERTYGGLLPAVEGHSLGTKSNTYIYIYIYIYIYTYIYIYIYINE